MKLEKHTEAMLKLNVSCAKNFQAFLARTEPSASEKLECAENAISMLVACIEHLLNHEME